MRVSLLIAAASLVAAASAFGVDNRVLRNLEQLGHHGHGHGDDGDDGDSAVVVTVKENSKHRGRSSSSSSSSSNQKVVSEQKQWDRRHLDNGDSQVLVSNSRLSRKEAGGSNSEEASSRSADSSDVAKSSLAVDGKTVVSNEKGSSDAFEESQNSTQSSEFEKSVQAEVTKKVVQQQLDLGCIARRRINVFVLLQLDTRWRHKLQFARRLVLDAFDPDRVNFVFVLFNEFPETFASFGPGGLRSKKELLRRLQAVERRLAREQRAGVTDHWRQFGLRPALAACFSYAQILPALSPRLGARPNLLLSYFDTDSAVASGTAAEAAAFFKAGSTNPFQLRVNILQQEAASTQPLPSEWRRLAAAMSSSQRHRLSRPRETQLLAFMAQLVSNLCQAKFLH